MVTVFAILLIVIFGSQLLIKLINRIAPEAEVPGKKQIAESADAGVRAVLDAAVAQITGGKGRIINVTKI